MVGLAIVDDWVVPGMVPGITSCTPAVGLALDFDIALGFDVKISVI
jgi:hypothetical protein